MTDRRGGARNRFRSRTHRLLAVPLALLCAASVPAQSDRFQYGPFPDSAGVQTVRLRDCVNDSEVWTIPNQPDSPTIRQIQPDPDKQAEFIVRLPDGREIKTEGAGILGPYLEPVRYGDLNRDGIVDFVAVKNLDGNGIGFGYLVFFVLSNRTGYVIQKMRTMVVEDDSLIDFWRNGRCQVIQTGFVFGEPGRDGRTHNYWVHRFLEIRGTDLVPSRRLAWRWVQFTFTPNHRETNQLTPEQKTRLWHSRRDNIIMQDDR